MMQLVCRHRKEQFQSRKAAWDSSIITTMMQELVLRRICGQRVSSFEPAYWTFGAKLLSC